MNRKLLILPAVAAVAAVLGLTGVAGASTTVTATTSIVNRADSGAVGNWGTDGTTAVPMTRQLTIVAGSDCGTAPAAGYGCYDATVSDSGDGTTRPNQYTPNQAPDVYAGLTIAAPAVTYSISGHAYYEFWANEAPAAVTVPGYENDHYGSPSGDHSTGDWPALAFVSGTEYSSGGSAVSTSFPATALEQNWSWTYDTACEQWTDAASNGDGDRAGDGNITGATCTPPPATCTSGYSGPSTRFVNVCGQARRWAAVKLGIGALVYPNRWFTAAGLPRAWDARKLG